MVKMRLDWLEDILAVAEAGSFSEAAERRHLTQSAFSRRIQTIEDQIGAPLFDRTCKPVQLLKHTEAQREQIALLARLLRQLGADLRRGDRMSENTLVISSQHSLTTSLTPSIIKDINFHHRDIFIRLRSANLADCFAQLLSRVADILIVYRLPESEHPVLGAYIESHKIGLERLIPVISPGALSALAASRAQGELPYVAYPAEVFLGQVLESRILPRLRATLDPSAKAETALTLASIEMATMGIGVAWVPESLARDRIASGKLTDLSPDLPGCNLEVNAVRLIGNPGRAEVVIWERLLNYELPGQDTGHDTGHDTGFAPPAGSAPA